MDTLQQIYSVLGLVRANNLWSWGAANENAVVLQVWTDEIKKSDSGLFFIVIVMLNANTKCMLGYLGLFWISSNRTLSNLHIFMCGPLIIAAVYSRYEIYLF